MSNNLEVTEQFKQTRIHSFLRDGIATEVFIGESDGEGIVVDDIEGISPVLRFLCESRVNIGYKSLFYLDGLFKHIDAYRELFEGIHTKQNTMYKFIKMPLFVPTEIEYYIRENVEHFILYAKSNEEETQIKEAIDAIFLLNTLYNEELIPAFLSYVKGEGIINHAGNAQTIFRAIVSNKDEIEKVFIKFKSAIENYSEIIKDAKHLFLIDDILNHFSIMKMQNVVYDIDEDTASKVVDLLANNKITSKMLFKGEDFQLAFSPTQKERPSYGSTMTLNESFLTFADLLIYTDVIVNDNVLKETANEALSLLHLYYLGIDENIEDVLHEITSTGDKYSAIYQTFTHNAENAQITIEKAYQYEVYKAFLTDFFKELKEKVNTLFSEMIKKELLKKEHSILIQKEHYVFIFIGHLIESSFKSIAYKLPYVHKDSAYYAIYADSFDTFCKTIYSDKASLYMEARQKIIANSNITMNEAENETASSSQKNTVDDETLNDTSTNQKVLENDTITNDNANGTKANESDWQYEEGEDDKDDEDKMEEDDVNQILDKI